MDFATLIPLILKYGSQIPQLVNSLNSLKDAARDLFPQVPPAKVPDASATLANVSGNKWVQTVLNLYGTQPPLEVDGKYGTLTKQAVTKYQQERGLSPVDGWAGDITQEDMRKWLSEKHTG